MDGCGGGTHLARARLEPGSADARLHACRARTHAASPPLRPAVPQLRGEHEELPLRPHRPQRGHQRDPDLQRAVRAVRPPAPPSFTLLAALAMRRAACRVRSSTRGSINTCQSHGPSAAAARASTCLQLQARAEVPYHSATKHMCVPQPPPAPHWAHCPMLSDPVTFFHRTPVSVPAIYVATGAAAMRCYIANVRAARLAHECTRWRCDCPLVQQHSAALQARGGPAACRSQLACRLRASGPAARAGPSRAALLSGPPRAAPGGAA